MSAIVLKGYKQHWTVILTTSKWPLNGFQSKGIYTSNSLSLFKNYVLVTQRSKINQFIMQGLVKQWKCRDFTENFPLKYILSMTNWSVLALGWLYLLVMQSWLKKVDLVFLLRQRIYVQTFCLCCQQPTTVLNYYAYIIVWCSFG